MKNRRWAWVAGAFLAMASCDMFSSDAVGSFVDAAGGDFDYLIGGEFQLVDGREQPYLARLDAAGELDGSFAAVLNGPVYDLTTIAWAGETQVLIGGAFSTVNGESRPGVALLGLDGSLDSGFAPDLGPAITALGDRAIYAVRPVPERGTVLVGGIFDGALAEEGLSVESLYANLAELNLGTGRAVPEFDPAPDAAVFDIAPSVSSAAEWRVVVGGEFFFIGGQPAPFAAEVNGDGDTVITIPEPTTIGINAGERISYILSGFDDNEFDMLVVGNSADLFGGYSVSGIYSGVGVAGSPGVFYHQGFELTRMDGYVNVISQTPNGRILYGGEFTVFDEFPGGGAVSAPYLAAYDEFGLDTEFPVTVDGPVYDAFVTPGPATIVAGAFATSSSSGSEGPGYLFRIDGDLQIDNGFSPELSRTDGGAVAVRVVRPIPGYD